MQMGDVENTIFLISVKQLAEHYQPWILDSGQESIFPEV